MKPILLQKNSKSALQSFVARHAFVPHLYNIWHYHKEIEFMFVIKSKGTRFVGDSIQPFFDGDMVMVGSNVPHFWQNDEIYFQGRDDIHAEVILIQFLENFMGEALELPEMLHIRRMFKDALHGIQFTGDTRDRAATMLRSIVMENGVNKIVELLQLLDMLARSGRYRLLSELPYQSVPNYSSERIQLVCSYLLKHYKSPVALAEVAKLANMTEKAFCRFFKKSTQKTLVQFITELRISHACKLLLTQNYQIGEVCYESGFGNLSNFNRVFKRITGQTPRQYQQAMDALNI